MINKKLSSITVVILQSYRNQRMRKLVRFHKSQWVCESLTTMNGKRRDTWSRWTIRIRLSSRIRSTLPWDSCRLKGSAKWGEIIKSLPHLRFKQKLIIIWLKLTWKATKKWRMPTMWGNLELRSLSIRDNSILINSHPKLPRRLTGSSVGLNIFNSKQMRKKGKSSKAHSRDSLKNWSKNNRRSQRLRSPNNSQNNHKKRHNKKKHIKYL